MPCLFGCDYLFPFILFLLMVDDESCIWSLLVFAHVVIWIRQTFVCSVCSGHPEPDAGCQSSSSVPIDLWPEVHSILVAGTANVAAV